MRLRGRREPGSARTRSRRLPRATTGVVVTRMCACEQVHNVTTSTPYAPRSELVTAVTLSWTSSSLDRPVQRNDAAGQVQPVDLAPAGLDHPQGEAALIGPAADRLGEVDVRLRVRRHPLGDARQGLH